MALVRIVGTGRVTDIARGDERVVEYTEHVQRVADRGGLIILEHIKDDDPVDRLARNPQTVKKLKQARASQDTAVPLTMPDIAHMTDEATFDLSSGGGASGAGAGKSDTVNVAASGPVQSGAVDSPDATPS